MLQSMSILQMGIQELREYVEEAIQENPVLELPEQAEVSAAADGADEALRKLEWLRSNDRQNIYYHVQDTEETDPLSRAGCYVDEESDLKRYILSQFMGADFPPEIMAAVEFLVDRLDDRGYLEEEPEELARLAGARREVIDRALIELQAADPAGVGARDLSQCLRLQLERQAGDNRLAVEIVEHYLDDFARSRFGVIARALGVEQTEVRRVCRQIQALNPRPAVGFSARENLTYITPDVIAAPGPEGLELTVNDGAIPRLRISGYYAGLLRSTEDKEVRDYLTERVNQAQWMIRAIDQRRSTILDCVHEILRRQDAFFRFGPSHLLPLTMNEVAQAVGVHESTVSRAVRDKYLQCPQGVYPLNYFFSRGLGNQTAGERMAAEPARLLLKKLIEEEDPARPLSDRMLSEAMAGLNCPISRRTVAKYREELGLPNASGRRRTE